MKIQICLNRKEVHHDGCLEFLQTTYFPKSNVGLNQNLMRGNGAAWIFSISEMVLSRNPR